MSLIDTLRSLPGGRPRKRKSLLDTRSLETLDKHRLVTTGILVLTVAAIVLISFIGIDSGTTPVFPNQISTVQITASAPFDYISAQKTADNREQIRNRIPRVYKLDSAPLDKFESAINELLASLETFEEKFQPANTNDSDAPAADAAALDNILNTFNARGPYTASLDQILALRNLGDANARRAYVETALLTLREINQTGIEDPSLTPASPPGVSTVSIIERSNGELVEHPIRSLADARSELRVNLAAEGAGGKTTRTLARLFDNALAPNIIFDAGRTESHIAAAIEKLPPATVHVDRGQTIIANGARVTPAQYEMLEAYRAWRLAHPDALSTADMMLSRRILLVLAMVLACALYIRMKDRQTLESNGRLALLALVVVANLALVRLTYWLSELPYFVHHSAAAATLPYLAPAAIAPMIVAILIETGPAIITALFISLFTSVIYGNRLDVLVVTFFASIIAVSSCQRVRSRGSIMSAAFRAGVALAGFALLFGLIDQQAFWLPDLTVPRQIIAALVNGLVTGIIVIGVLPLIESLFKRTTDITLLELTDYNRPLLRSMQMDAPGSYHHSLVVAQLAENAAAAIGANPLLARVCALYHDIGKINHPEYYTENQRDRANPHDENNPSLSALIIKSHVKDGVDLALKNRLPRPVVDVIQQHHGTGLIRYFYQRALNEQRAQYENSRAPFVCGNGAGNATRPPFPAPAGATRPPFPPQVSEATYRYDGPLPQFKESAIIHLADSIEAASRSLKKVTPQHLGDLIDQIVKERIDDGQLAEAPITFEDLAKIKTSFALTLLNMLHSRVAYPPANSAVPSAPAESKDDDKPAE